MTKTAATTMTDNLTLNINREIRVRGPLAVSAVGSGRRDVDYIPAHGAGIRSGRLQGRNGQGLGVDPRAYP
jgi:hypothetical protein